MKHAYLIIAHEDWDMLKALIGCIDDERNDIFIHFDSKVSQMPVIVTNKSGLYVIDDRVDIRWADVSMIQAEYALFQEAIDKGPYAYYHLMSGVDLPIKTQDYIHDFFNEHQGTEFVGFSSVSMTDEVKSRVRFWYLFPRSFRNAGLVKRALRKTFIMLQSILPFQRNKSEEFRKGPQWVSITHELLSYLMEQKSYVLQIYKHSFCSDELFIQSLVWNSYFKDRVFCLSDEYIGSMREIKWRSGSILTWNNEDMNYLMNSKCLFARKFDSRDSSLIESIVSMVAVAK